MIRVKLKKDAIKSPACQSDAGLVCILTVGKSANPALTHGGLSRVYTGIGNKKLPTPIADASCRWKFAIYAGVPRIGTVGKFADPALTHGGLAVLVTKTHRRPACFV
ncbi:hypothetical protein J6590_056711 [Homalodisca vitripennis]|nr:hypothetical protein J6590_056711 [Homalodisca vitripennis]